MRYADPVAQAEVDRLRAKIQRVLAVIAKDKRHGLRTSQHIDLRNALADPEADE